MGYFPSPLSPLFARLLSVHLFLFVCLLFNGSEAVRPFVETSPQILNSKQEGSENFIRAALKRWPNISENEFVAVDAPPHRFLRFSAYRYNETTIFVIGLAASRDIIENGGPAEICLWLPTTTGSEEISENMEAIRGTATNLFVGESHGRIYETVVVQCGFPESGVQMGIGGRLFVRLKQGSNATIDASPILLPALYEPIPEPNPEAMSEASPKSEPIAKPFPKPLPLVEVAHCSSPLYGKMHPMRMREWYEYYNALYGQSAFFFMYDVNGLSEEIRETMAPFVSSKILTIIDMREGDQYDTWWHNQLLALTDCLHRARHKARWVANFDYDEYLIIQPPQTIKILTDSLLSYDAISFGSYLYSTYQCVDEIIEPAWAVERAIYRKKMPVCNPKVERFRQKEEVCALVHGRRKWLANTNSIILPSIHEVRDATLKGTKAVTHVLNTTTARFGHFRYLLTCGKENCRQMHDSKESEVEDKYSFWGSRGYVKDTTISDFAHNVQMLLKKSSR